MKRCFIDSFFLGKYISVSGRDGQVSEFYFDSILQPDIQQQEVFEHTAVPLLSQLLIQLNYLFNILSY